MARGMTDNGFSGGSGPSPALQPTAPVSLTEREHRKVIIASSLGTVFEWYDFYLYGTLAAFFSVLFFPQGNTTAALLASLATFGAGFAVRPLGAFVFGHLGDSIGRKQTFLLTITLMGAATFAVGLLPTYDQIGILAPMLLVALRLVQGLALGGEYGGAVTYVAEHAPVGRRGAYTSWIQTTATLGFLLSLGVILACRSFMSDEAFREWGWRIPFLLSIILLAVSVQIRVRLNESPVFRQMQQQNRLSKSPVRESLGQWTNSRYILLALFGATAGQGVVWYTGQFYSLYFLQNTLRVDYSTAYVLIAIALVIGTPLFVLFGSLSDRIGRKKVMMAGLLLTAVTVLPLFQGLAHYANPVLANAMHSQPVTVTGSNCEFRALSDRQATPCAQALALLTRNGVSYTLKSGPAAGGVTVEVGDIATLSGFQEKALTRAIDQAGYRKADPGAMNKPMVILILVLLMSYVAMVYGPIAAYLVELFPARIRYTSLSIPYHLGNGWFGGFLPFIALSISAATGNIYAGLWYPIAIAVMSLVVGGLLLRETKDRDLSL
jgi:MFS family permease